MPTSVTSEEARQALDSGIVKSIAFAPHAHMSFGIMEAAKWWTADLNPGTVNCPIVVNTDALDARTMQAKDVPALQAVLADVAEPLRTALLALPGLYGGPEVLERAAACLPQDAIFLCGQPLAPFRIAQRLGKAASFGAVRSATGQHHS